MTFSYRFAILFFSVLYNTYFRRRVYNVERVPATGRVILAVNHASYVDPTLVGSSIKFRDINYLARENLFRIPVLGFLLRSWNGVPVDREGGGAKGLKIILDRLLGGAGILLFPEGTRTYDGKLQPARSGIGLTVIKTEAPVIPVRIFGSYEAYSRNMKIPKFRGLLVVKFGLPIDFSALRAEAKTCTKPRLKQIYQEVADRLMLEIGKLEPKED